MEIKLIDKSWIERVRSADLVCSACGDSYNDSKGGSWRFAGFHWEHHCENAGQCGHFIGVMRKQLEKERKITAANKQSKT